MKRYLSGLLASCLLLSMASTSALATAFIDVENHWAKESIETVVEKGLFQGDGEHFSPDGIMTRGMFVTVLGRFAQQAGLDTTSDVVVPFADVSADAYYAPYVAWANEHGIVQGYGKDSFAPDAPVTREQMCAFFLRFLKEFDYEYSAYMGDEVVFIDQDSIGAWAVSDVALAQGLGLITGKMQEGGLAFAPADNATRGEVSVVFVRLTQLLDKIAVVPEEGALGGPGSPVLTPEEEAEAESQAANALKKLLDEYQNSTYLPTADQEVQDLMADLMDTIETALDAYEGGASIEPTDILADYKSEINEVKVGYGNLTEEQKMQVATTILYFDTEVVEMLLEFFDVDIESK